MGKIFSFLRLSGLAFVLHLCTAEPDFETCWKKAQNASLLTDPAYRGDFSNQTNFANYEPGRIYLTLDGCNNLCGKGFQLWPAGETAVRFAVFVLPLVILGLAFSVKPDLGFGTQVFSFFHLVGNPIDSLWSILVRQEAARRNYALSAEMVPSASREVAAILTAYDQWWQDARQHFENSLRKRDGLGLPDMPLPNQMSPSQTGSMGIQDTTNGMSSTNDEAVRNAARPRNRFQRTWQRIWPLCGRVRSAETSESQRLTTVTMTGNLKLEEICEVRRTAQKLAAHRNRKFFQTWVSIILFLVSACTGYLRAVEYYDKRKNSQTAHTLAIVMLFSWLLFAVYINGHVGNFDEEREVLNIINELRTGTPESLGSLFPELHLRNRKTIEFALLFEQHRAHSVNAGIINNWRPDKQLRAHDLDDRSTWTLLEISLLAVFISWGAAFTISYRTPTIGFGCRSLAWTCIMAAWILNAVFSIPGEIIMWNGRNRWGISARKLWIWSYCFDIIVTLGIIVTIVLAQLGIMNTCWCRAGLTANPILTAVEIGPPTASMRREGTTLWLCTSAACLACIFVIIAYAALDGENGRLLFVRSQAESMAEQRGIQLEKGWLEAQRPRGSNDQRHSTVGGGHPMSEPSETSPLLPADSSDTDPQSSHSRSRSRPVRSLRRDDRSVQDV